MEIDQWMNHSKGPKICDGRDLPQISAHSYKSNAILRACLHGGGGPQIGEVTCGGSPHLSCKRDQIKMRDYMDRRVTPP